MKTHTSTCTCTCTPTVVSAVLAAAGITMISGAAIAGALTLLKFLNSVA